MLSSNTSYIYYYQSILSVTNNNAFLLNAYIHEVKLSKIRRSLSVAERVTCVTDKRSNIAAEDALSSLRGGSGDGGRDGNESVGRIRFHHFQKVDGSELMIKAK